MIRSVMSIYNNSMKSFTGTRFLSREGLLVGLDNHSIALLGVNKNRRSSPQLNRAAARDVDLYQSNRGRYGSFCER